MPQDIEHWWQHSWERMMFLFKLKNKSMEDVGIIDIDDFSVNHL
jgi:hypothetical protein